MPRSATSIQAEITILETFLSSADSFLQTINSDNTGVTKFSRKDATERLDELYGQLQRANRGSMFARTRIKNIGAI